jgi:hypothetical protein
MMRIPNFFIIGAPKCGTTSIAYWLTKHPQVFFSPVKEPHFFSTDEPSRPIDDLRRYERLFQGAGPHHAAVGEGSTGYLASQTAVPGILAYNPNARFIICLRNPADMACSLHAEQLAQGQEHIADFATAWRLCGERAAGREVSRWCDSAKGLDYASVCSLGSHLERLFSMVDRARIHVLLFDDLTESAATVYRGILKFLGIDDDGSTTFEVRNSRSRLRSNVLKKAVLSAGKLKRSLGIEAGIGVLNAIDRANRKSAEPFAITTELRDELNRHFRPEVEKMARLLSRSFSHWM